MDFLTKLIESKDGWSLALIIIALLTLAVISLYKSNVTRDAAFLSKIETIISQYEDRIERLMETHRKERDSFYVVLDKLSDGVNNLSSIVEKRIAELRALNK